jgi:hypothetical protein
MKKIFGTFRFLAILTNNPNMENTLLFLIVILSLLAGLLTVMTEKQGNRIDALEQRIIALE